MDSQDFITRPMYASEIRGLPYRDGDLVVLTDGPFKGKVGIVEFVEKRQTVDLWTNGKNRIGEVIQCAPRTLRRLRYNEVVALTEND